MKPYVQSFWTTIKEYFSRPKVIRWTVAILTLVIVLGSVGLFFWTIYTKDKPAFVPEDVREDIQGVIKESGEDIKTLSEPLGGAIVDAAFDDEACCSVVEDTEAWPTYTDEELGISFRYPEGWVVEPIDFGAKIFKEEYRDYSSEFPMLLIRSYDLGNESLEAWLDDNKQIFIGEQDPSMVVGFLDREGGLLGSFETLSFTYENMGSNRVTLINKIGTVIVAEDVTLGAIVSSTEKNYENVLSSIR